MQQKVVPVSERTFTKVISTKIASLRIKPYRDRSWTKKGECADCKMFRYCEGNGMHLYDDNGNLLVCHYKRIVD